MSISKVCIYFLMHFVNKLVFFSFPCTSNLAQMSENLYSNIFCFGNLETLQNLSRLRSTLRMKVNVKVICTSDVDVPISIFFLCLLYLSSDKYKSMKNKCQLTRALH